MSISAAGRQPDRNPAWADHQQHGDLHPVYHPGAVPDPEKKALYYGINALSNNLIMVDRKLLKNPNGLILGTPGSGKSFSAKREIANCFLLTSDDVIICDPEAEYAPLVERLHGQVIKISPTSTNYINPMDINLDNSATMKARCR